MPNYISSAATKSAIEAILKEKWVTEEIQRQYSRDRVLLALFEKNSKQVDGLESVFTMRLEPNASTGARGEMESLPDAGRQTTKKVRIPLSYWYTVCAFSGQAIKASNNSATSLAKIIADEMQNAVEDHKRVENAYLYGDGSGALAQITAISSKTFTVSIWSNLFTPGRSIETSATKDGATLAMSANRIVSVNRAAKTITLADTPTSAANNHYIFLKGTRGNANMGLMGICDDGGFVSTFQTLSRTDYPQLKAKVFGNNGTSRNISESILMDVIARMREDGATPDIMIGTSFQLKDLCAEMHQQRRFIDDGGELDLGIRGIKVGDGIDFTFDLDCPPGYAFALNKKNIIISEAAPLSFMDLDGNVMSRIDGIDGYEATLFHYFNLIALSCYDQARIEDLNENRVGD